MFNLDAATSRRRSTLIAIILATIPCYCIGWLAWTLTPEKPLPTATPSITPISSNTVPATITPWVLVSVTSGPSSTPGFVTPTYTPYPTYTFTATSSRTPEPSWTPFLPPTLTFTPSWTPRPTSTFTSVPASLTPVPSSTPVPPTSTQPPVFTHTPSATAIVIGSTPTETPTETITPIHIGN